MSVEFPGYRMIVELDVGPSRAFRAVEEKTGRDVVIKLLSSEAAARPGFRPAMEKLGPVLEGLSHRNICRFYGCIESGTGLDRSVAFCYQYMEGDDLGRWYDRNSAPGAVSGDTLGIYSQIVDGVCYLHSMKVIHAGIKPSSIIVSPKGLVKLTDIGFYELAGLSSPGESHASAFELCFRAPEQVAGKAVYRRSDIYSLGVLLYWLITGQPPFVLDGKSIEDLAREIRRSGPEERP
ncbi:protein kinase, partial [Candidatus Fermentibacterales bacterium]|nr:protein kinase [Candidatus Fermentibacterales bacterium]